MDKWTQLTRQPEYLHLVLNHWPIVGLAVAPVFLLGALLLRQRGGILLALVLCTLLTGSTVAVLQSGEAAYNRVLGSMPQDPASDIFLRIHAEQAREKAFLFYGLTAGLVVLTAAAFRSSAVLNWGSPLALIAGGVCLWQTAQIAETGGQIKHRELRVHGLPTKR